MNKKTREKRKVERQRIKLWHAYYENCIAADKEMIRGCEQVAQVHSAYISILLKRLGATEGNAVVISPQEISEAMKKELPRANVEDGTYKLYYVVEE